MRKAGFVSYHFTFKIKFTHGENHILFAEIKDGLGTLLMSRNVPHGQAVDSGQFSLSERQSEFEN
jgi:hypothetical protein